jgi:cytochrome oxidase assembly protein ShyY1
VLRFLLTPRWIGLFIVVVVLGFTCGKLSEWQFHRYSERGDSNAVQRANLDAPPVAVSSLLSTSKDPTPAIEWRTVSASGRYDATHQIAVLYRTRDGAPGVDVVTPFITSSGSAVLVDRGWISSVANGNQALRLPPPAAGVVRIEGWVRADSTGGSSQVTPSQGSVRAISADAIGPTLPYPVYDGFVSLTHETPASPHAPAKAGGPDLSGGPSFFYGVQWLFFALLFLGFWGYFAWAEYREKLAGDAAGRGPRPPKPPRKPWRPGADAEDDLVSEPTFTSHD